MQQIAVELNVVEDLDCPVEELDAETQRQVWQAHEAVKVVTGERPHGAAHATEEEVTSAWQYLINEELVTGLGEWFSRTARAMLDSGECIDPRGRRH